VGEALAAALAALGPPPADALTWVPLAPRRRAERGFDQARVLAKALARDLELPAAAFVRRTAATGPQSRRAREERLGAMTGAFTPVSHRPPPARLLLVDDVFTTGATATACAATLVRAGAREIHVLTACRSFSGPPPGPDRPPKDRPGRPPGSRRP
jgi:competence protein ComFC